jgi:hypothetical protein
MSNDIHHQLAAVAEELGFDSVDHMLFQASGDSAAPGLCQDCGALIYEIEPDSDEGWCPECGANTVTSVLVLAGVL